MVKIAVAGGTGTAGRIVVEDAAGRGCGVRSLSRHVPSVQEQLPGVEYMHTDFRTGEGVAAALAGVDVLVETLDARPGSALQALPVTTIAILGAARRAGLSRCVLLSIANAGQSTMGYYQTQAARARSYEQAGMPTSVVYATQFHNLVAGIFAAGAKVGLMPVFRGASFQPVSTADVARALVDEALVPGAEMRHLVVGGPEVKTMKELAKEWKSGTGSRAMVASVPIPGSFGKFLKTGKNIVPDAAVGLETFSEWLERRKQGSA